MPRERVYEAVTERLGILDADGQVDQALLPSLADDQLVELHRQMTWMRAFDDKAVKLQRQGRMGTWAPNRGQEAVSAGVGLAMAKDDWLVPAFRENGLMILRGVPAHILYAYWAGDERGSHFPVGVRCFPIAVPVGSQWQHGAGVGMSLALRNENAAAVVFGGDGSTSQGDFHEALNFAAVFRARTGFVIQNNQWAISIPVAGQTASQTLAQKAHAYGMPGLQVDGNDVLAVDVATREALERARRGDGPSLVEAVTYRLGDHTTADDASRYRPKGEVEAWQGRDPIRRLRLFLEVRGLWDDGREKTLQEETARWVEEQVRSLEAMSAQEPEEIFRHMYGEMPGNLREQMASLAEEAGR